MTTHRLVSCLLGLGLVLTPAVAIADSQPEPATPSEATKTAETPEGMVSSETSTATETVTATQAESEETASFSSDRPGFGNVTSVMAPLRFGFEMGVSMESSMESVGFAVPNLLIRMGLASWLEARFALPSVRLSPDQDATSTNAGVGIKIGFELFEGFAMSYVAMFDTPVVVNDQGAGLYNGLNLAYQLSDTWGLAATGTVTLRDRGSDALGWEAGASLALSASLGDDASIYVETNGTTDETGEARYGFGVGTTRMLTDTMQFDLFLEYGLGESGTTVVVGSGVSFML